MRRLALLALAALATAAAAAAPHHDFGPLADLLAGVLVVREGGVSAAMDALPNLHDTTHVREKKEKAGGGGARQRE